MRLRKRPGICLELSLDHKAIKRLTLILSLLLFNLQLFAQKPEMERGKMEALNDYIEFANSTMYALYLMAEPFELLNQECLAYYEGNRSDLSYSYNNYIVRQSPYGELPGKLFNKIQADKELNSREKGILQGAVMEAWGILNELDVVQKKFKEYVDSGTYRSDEKLGFAFDQLNRVAILYHDFKSIRDRMEWQIKDVYNNYQIPADRKIMASTKKSFDALFRGSEEILEAFRDENSAKAMPGQAKFKEAFDYLKNNQSAALDEVHSSKQAKAQQAYNECLLSAKEFSEVAERALDPSNHYPANGYSRYYNIFNKELSRSYNSYGNRLVYHFNQLLKNSGAWYRYQLEEPVYFKVLLPGDFEEEEVPDLVFEPKPGDEPEEEVVQTLEGFADNNLILLLDISASMASEEKIPLMKKSLSYLLTLMRPQDNITIITFSNHGRVLLPQTSAVKQEEILSVIENLRFGGVSNANDGLRMAYEESKTHFIEGGNNRIILATDGQFRLDKKLEEKIPELASAGVNLTLFLFGDRDTPETVQLLQGLAQKGGGNYAHIREENADRTLLLEAQAVKQ